MADMTLEWITTVDARGDAIHVRVSRIVALRDYGGSCAAIMDGGGEIALRACAATVLSLMSSAAEED